jgi:hypothetical protein
MSAWGNFRTSSPCNWALTPGCFSNASAVARTSRSLTETFVPPAAFIAERFASSCQVDVDGQPVMRDGLLGFEQATRDRRTHRRHLSRIGAGAAGAAVGADGPGDPPPCWDAAYASTSSFETRPWLPVPLIR